MKAKTLKSIAVAMSLAVMPMVGATLALNPIVAYAAEIDSVAFQEAINAEGSNITAVPYSPTEGETYDKYNMNYWTVDENGCTYTSKLIDSIDGVYSKGLIHITLPTDGNPRTLKFDIAFDGYNYRSCTLYADGYSEETGTKLGAWFCTEGTNQNVEINVGTTTTEFYLLLDMEDNKNYCTTISNLQSITEIETYTVGELTTAVFQNGTLTFSGTGAVEDISSIPDAIKSEVTKIVFEEGVTSISDSLFKNMTGITQIDFPESLEYIGASAFEGCTGLTEICLDCPKLELNSFAFKNCSNVSKVFVNISSEFIAEYGANNSGFVNSATTGDDGNTVPFYNVGSNVGGIDIVFGEDMTVIGEGLFLQAYSIKSITIPDSINTMGVKLHPITNTYRIFETLNQIGDVAVYTDNDVAKAYDWASDGLTTNISTYSESPSVSGGNSSGTGGGNTGDSGNGGSGGSDTETDVIEPKEESMTITGTVQPITTMDITLELDGISFNIDSDRNFTGQSGTIINSSSFPIDVYLMNIVGKTGSEPTIVANDKFTEKEWNNLSVRDTLSYMAISINDQNLSQIYNNNELDSSKMLKLGNLKSAYTGDTSLELVPSALYGKNFGNAEEMSVLYDLVIEFIIP